MRDKPARESVPTPAAFINAQSAITGLRGRDLISTLRSVAAHGLRNPDVRHREWGLSTYVEAVEEAMNVCRAITGAREVNLMGACAGGLTIAALQGHLQAKRQLRRVSSATYLVSLLDSQMESPATLFADEQTLEAAKRRSYQKGVLDGRDMAKVFAWMRPNDLIWSYFVNNYLLLSLIHI